MSRSVQDLGEADDDRWAVGFAGDEGLGVFGEVLVEVSERDALGGACFGDGLACLCPVQVGQRGGERGDHAVQGGLPLFEAPPVGGRY
ncbi:hypothetical protein ABZ667_43025 [Streptomyces lavendulae]|uniref:hypothetical protein n=1 Tax=Streptomyces lavendulae TaxID=1914 RepID=UPI003401BA37